MGLRGNHLAARLLLDLLQQLLNDFRSEASRSCGARKLLLLSVIDGSWVLTFVWLRIDGKRARLLILTTGRRTSAGALVTLEHLIVLRLL